MQGAQKTEARGVYRYTLSGAVCSATQQMSVFQQPHSPGFTGTGSLGWPHLRAMHKMTDFNLFVCHLIIIEKTFCLHIYAPKNIFEVIRVI
jgi:hypothetical protein